MRQKNISPIIIHSENKEDIIREYVFSGIGNHIPDEKSKLYLVKKKKVFAKLQ